MKKSPIKNIYRPQLQSLLKRQRVFDEIQSLSYDHSVIWLEGVAGSGKTTLINSYLEERQDLCLWYSLDNSDNDISLFFNRLKQCINIKLMLSEKTISLLSLPFKPEYKSVAKFFFREIQEHIGSSFSLVLDDYHLIHNDDFHEMLVETLLYNNQGKMRVYIISRTPPASIFARLQAKRLLACINKQSLQFTDTEINDLVSLLTGKTLSKNHLKTLTMNTQGWVSGVVLLLNLSQSDSNCELNLDSENMELLFNYFASELFVKLEPSIQVVLLKSSYLQEIDIVRDCSLFKEKELNRILPVLYKRNYFTYQCKYNSNVYRFHPLFRKFLRETANSYFKEKELFEFKRQIAALLNKHGNTEAVILLYFEIHEWERAIDLIETFAPKLISKGQSTQLLQWIDQLPECAIEHNPWILYWKANCILAYDQLDAYETFILAYQKFEERNDSNGQYYSICGILESVLFSFNNYHRINPWTNKVSELHNAGIKPKGLELSARLSADMHTALLFCEPFHPDLAKWEKNVGYLMKLLKVSFSEDHIVLVGVNLFYQYLWAGEREKAQKVLDITQPSSSNEIMNPVSQGAWYLMASVNSWLDGNPDDGLFYADKGLQNAERTGVTFWAGLLLIQKAYCFSRRAEYHLAREVLQEYQNLSARHSQISDSIFYDISSQLDYYTGDLESALQNCLICVEKSKNIGLLYSDVGFRISLAELSIAKNDYIKAEEIIQIAKKECISWKCDLYLYRCYLVETMLNLKKCEYFESRTSMENALKLALYRGFTNHSWWRSDHITPLYEFALEQNIETDFVMRCIVQNKLEVNIPLIEYEHWPWKVKIKTLGELSIHVENHEISTLGKSLRKPISLLKALLSLGPWRVNQARLAELLWPDAEADEAIQTLNTTIYRLRKIIGSKAIWVKDGNVGLNKEIVWVDVERVKHFLDQCNEILQKTSDYPKLTSVIDKIITCYHGRFLEKEIEDPWIYRFAQELENRVLNALYASAKHAEKKGDNNKALHLLDYARSLNILNESAYRKNIALLMELGRHTEAKLLFKECKTLLSRTLGIKPSQDLYQLIRQ